MSHPLRYIANIRNISLFSHATSFSISKSQSLLNCQIHAGLARNFYLSSIRFLKLYCDNENAFAHSVMETNHLYSKTIFQNQNAVLENNSLTENNYQQLIEEDWDLKPSDEIIIAFKKIAMFAKHNHKKISSSEFNEMTKAIISKMGECSDTQIEELLLYLSFFEEADGIKDSNFCSLWTALDEACKSRSHFWDIDKILFYCDLWYNLKLVRHSKFIEAILTKVGRKVKTLTPQQLTQIMFYINSSRRPLCTMMDFEKSLHNCLCELSTHEIAIAAMSFFKTKTPIHNPHLLEHIIYRTIESADNIHEIALCAISKVIRYSMPISLQQPLSFLLHNMVKQIPRLSLLCCVHIALLGTNIQMHNPKLMNEIAKKCTENISTIRLKDMERLAFAFTLFDYDDGGNSIYLKMLKEIKKPERDEEINKYPRSFACLLYYLSLRNLYDSDLLNEVLSPSFLTNTYGEGYYNIGREILFLDCSIDVEIPSYNGNRLNGVKRQRLAKKLTRNIDLNGKIHKPDLLFVEVLRNVQSLYGNEKYAAHVHILPHFEKSDIMICLDNDGAPQSVVWQNFYEAGAVQTIDKTSEFKWIAMIIGTKNQLLFGSYQYAGLLLTKIRQLETLGYLPIVIPWHEWYQLTDDKKHFYLETKINEVKNSDTRYALKTSDHSHI